MILKVPNLKVISNKKIYYLMKTKRFVILQIWEGNAVRAYFFQYLFQLIDLGQAQLKLIHPSTLISADRQIWNFPDVLKVEA